MRLRWPKAFKNVWTSGSGAFFKARAASKTGGAVAAPTVSIAPISEGDGRHFASGQVISFIDARLMIC